MKRLFLRALLAVSMAYVLEAEIDMQESSHWAIERSETGWHLLREGEPFFVTGAFGEYRMDLLAEYGGNAVRASARRESLDEAGRHGLAVMVNLPVRGERSGLDWDDLEQVAAQKERILEIVAELMDHPAVMFWSVGNELDYIPGRDGPNPVIWERLNDLAAAIKKVDPHHPVLTVVGTDRFAEKASEMARICTDMDLFGINAYGDLDKVTRRAAEVWPVPFVITEWGPTGHWQVPRTQWSVPIEQNSSQKAEVIRQRYESAILANPSHCLGSFVFYWSEKQETTHSWYGLFRDGLITESIDTMKYLWTGSWPGNRAPRVHELALEGSADPQSVYLEPGRVCFAGVVAEDPDADPLVFAWDIRPEVEIPPDNYAGNKETAVRPIEGLIVDASRSRVEFKTPDRKGPYRLFVQITDGKGHAAYGNIPFFVGSPEDASQPPRAVTPF